ncbi:hypothetical protein HN873_034985 [Arachis hypogaea]
MFSQRYGGASHKSNMKFEDHFNQYLVLQNLSCLLLQDLPYNIKMHLIVVYMRQIQQLKN